MPKGLATWLGIIFAVSQYAGAIAVFLASTRDDIAIGALGTATATLLATILGRMYQGGKAFEAFGSKWGKKASSGHIDVVDLIDRLGTELRLAVDIGAEAARASPIVTNEVTLKDPGDAKMTRFDDDDPGDDPHPPDRDPIAAKLDEDADAQAEAAEAAHIVAAHSHLRDPGETGARTDG